jgi:hypothetical protein
LPTTVDLLLEDLVALRTKLEAAQASYDAAIEQLDAAYRDNLITDDQLTRGTLKFSRQSRKSYTFPDDHPINKLSADLKTQKELAIALGEAEERITYFWTVRKVKAKGDA